MDVLRDWHNRSGTPYMCREDYMDVVRKHGGGFGKKWVVVLFASSRERIRRTPVICCCLMRSLFLVHINEKRGNFKWKIEKERERRILGGRWGYLFGCLVSLSSIELEIHLACQPDKRTPPPIDCNWQTAKTKKSDRRSSCNDARDGSGHI